MSINRVNNSGSVSSHQGTIPQIDSQEKQALLVRVAQYGMALQDASEALRNDREIVLVAVTQNGMALEYASEALRNDREIVLAAVTQYGLALQVASAELQNDREIVLTAVTGVGAALKNASKALRNDREIVLAAVTQNGWALEDASVRLQNDREIVLAAVMQTTWALAYASEVLKNDREIVLIAVTQSGLALEYTSAELQNDREIVLAAVTQNGLVLEHASEALRNDREIVLAAVMQNGLALEYASEALQNDREIVLAAVTQNSGALRFASADQWAEFESLANQNHTNIYAEQNIRNRFKAAVADEELKQLDLETFAPSLQPYITSWFEQLLETETFKNPQSASILATQVYGMFAYAKENPEYAAKLSEELENAQISCSDSSLVIYNTLSVTKKLLQVFTKSIPEIIELCRGLYKLSLLEIRAFEQYQQVGGDQISIALGMQSRLREALSLPLDFDEVRFDQGWTGLTESAVQAAEKFVVEALKDPNGFIQYLSELEPWQTYLLTTDEEVKGKHTKISDEFGLKLEEVLDAAGTLSDLDYKTKIDAIVADRIEAFKKLFNEETRQIVEKVSISSGEEVRVISDSSGAASSGL